MRPWLLRLCGVETMLPRLLSSQDLLPIHRHYVAAAVKTFDPLNSKQLHSLRQKLSSVEKQNATPTIIFMVALACLVGLFCRGSLPAFPQSYQSSNVEPNPYIYYGEQGAGGQSTTTLYNPLITGAQSTPAGQAPVQGQAPPVGSDLTPLPVNPGMGSSPLGGTSNVFPQMSNSDALTGGSSSPPSKANNTVPAGDTATSGLSAPLYLPAVSPLDTTTVNSALSPYLQSPPSTPGTPPPGVSGDNSGLIYAKQYTNSTNSTSTFYPPANIGGVGANGGITGTAPIQKWSGQQAQTTHDYGLRRTMTNGQLRAENYNTDYGQNIDNLLTTANPGATRTQVPDVPRATTFLNWMPADSSTEMQAANQASDYTDAVRSPSPNMPDAITTWNLFGSRQNFRFQPESGGNANYTVPHSLNGSGAAVPAQQTAAYY